MFRVIGRLRFTSYDASLRQGNLRQVHTSLRTHVVEKFNNKGCHGSRRPIIIIITSKLQPRRRNDVTEIPKRVLRGGVEVETEVLNSDFVA